MGVLATLVPQAQPTLFESVQAWAGEGRTWEFVFTDFVDQAGDPIDLSGVTCTCRIVTGVLGSTVLSLTATGAADGSLTLFRDEADTVNLVPAGRKTYACRWGLTLADGTDVIDVWSPLRSSFTIEKGLAL